MATTLRLCDLAGLPPTLTAKQTAELLGESTWSLQDRIRRGTAPVAPLSLGRYQRFRTTDVLRLLGVDPAWLLGGQSSVDTPVVAGMAS